MTKAQLQVNKRKPGLIYFSAFALPVIMFMLLCAANGKLPFGDSSYLGGDMVNQYIKYFSYLQSIAAGENDVFYTYSKTLGGDMTGIWAYYLLSPFNVIFFFVPKAAFPVAITWLIAIKLGLCGLTMAILLTQHRRNCASVLIFSTAYAFMSYNLAYFNNIMWLDGVYMLPLAVLGLERVIAGKSAAFYTVSLALALIFNYYIAYMICIFMVLFFIYRMAVDIICNGAGLKKPLLHFVAGSLLAGAIAAFVLVPTALSLGGTKAGFDTAKLSMYPMYTLSQQLSKLVCSAMPTGFVEGDELMRELPFVYCGAVTTAFALMYFFNTGIKRSERAVSALFLLLLYLSFNMNGSYVIWHAFNYTALFPYRNAFLISFVMIFFAWRSYLGKDSISIKTALFSALVAAGAVFVIDPLNNLMIPRKMLLLDLGVIAVCAALSLWKGKRKKERLCALLIAAMQFTMLFINGDCYASGGLNKDEYAAYVGQKGAEIEKIKELDDGFYRVGSTGDEFNENMLFAYNGLSHFSSTEKTDTKNFAVNFGFCHFADVWAKYRDGSTSSADAFLGMKYINGHVPEYKGYKELSAGENGSLYQNVNALDIAMLANVDVLNQELDVDDIFLWQERVFSAALGREAGIFKAQEKVEFEAVNMKARPYGDGATEYLQIEPDREHSLVYRFTVTDDAPLYMYTTEPLVEGEVRGTLFVNGEDRGPYMGSFDWRAVYLGCFEPGEEIEVVIRPDAQFYLLYNTYFAYEDQQALAQVCDEIRTRTEPATFEKLRNSQLRWQGTVGEENTVLLLTVPDDKGWRAEVDGKAAEILTALDTLIAIELEAGEHTVELRFTPPGLYAGLGITLAALLIFAVLAKKKII